MKELSDLFQPVFQFLGERISNILVQPVFWVLIFLLIGTIVLTYSGASQGRLSSSIVNTVRQVGNFFMDTFNSIVQAVKSLFGFLDVIRTLFFGRLGQSTLYVLNNYAIIFLSMASFATTMQGLFSLIGWTGILVSFGVQVMELVATMGYIFCWVPPKGKLKETVTYTYCEPDTPETRRCEEDSGTGGVSEEDVKTLEERLKEDPPEKTGFWWGSLRRRVFPVLLLFAYIASVFFSYCYMFDAIVMPEIAYDDYMESIDMVTENIEKFEQELTAYRAELVRGLGWLNNDISRSFADKGYSTLEARLQAAQSSYEAAERAVSDAWEAAQAAAGTPDYERMSGIYENAVAARDARRVEYDGLVTDGNSGEYAVFQAVQRLSSYYADPLYLLRGAQAGAVAEAIEAAVNDVNRDFTTVLEMARDPNGEFSIAASEDGLRTAFSNLTNLSRYYAEHAVDGLDLSGEDGVEAQLERRSEILAEYDRLKNPSEDNAGGNAEASSYLNGETGSLLIAAMRALETVPRFSTVGQLWSGNDAGITPHEPSISEYLGQFNQKYRATNGQLSLQERAIFKLGSPNCATAWFSLIMALALDGMIIALCFVRERRYYTDNARIRRQMAAMLFVIPVTEAEQESNEQGRRIILSGTVMGCLIYLIYFKLFPNAGGDSAVMAFVLVVFGIMLMALLGALRNTFQKKKPVIESDPPSGPAPGQPGEPEGKVTPIKERLTPPAFELFNSGLECARFQRRSTVRRPKALVEQEGAKHFQREKMIWRQSEEHKIHAQVLRCGDYETVVTSCSDNMEYYVMERQVKEHGLMFHFAILLSHGLAYCVLAPGHDNIDTCHPCVDGSGNDSSDGDNGVPSSQSVNSSGTDAGRPAGDESGANAAVRPEGPGMERAYLLTRDFVRLIYECILLRTINGNNWEYGMEDDLLDYEREDDDDEE